MGPPLHGVRILDLTRLLPGAYATLVLSDLGAEVIKIEDPHGGVGMRRVAGNVYFVIGMCHDEEDVRLEAVVGLQCGCHGGSGNGDRSEGKAINTQPQDSLERAGGCQFHEALSY